MEVVMGFKYLGVELSRTWSWKEVVNRLKEKAERRGDVLMSIGAYGGGMRMKTALALWQALGVPLMEYGCEVWRPSKKGANDLEIVQLSVAKRILGVSRNTASVAVLSELGLAPLEKRREMMAMRYYGRLVRMEDTRMVKRIFRMRKDEWCNGRGTEGSVLRGRQEKGWMAWMEGILLKYDLEDAWRTERVGSKKDWELQVEMALDKNTKEWWKKETEGMPTLERYRNVVCGWSGVPQRYIADAMGKNSGGAMQMARLRCGANSLMISQGRHNKPEDYVERNERRCRCCNVGKNEIAPVENESHFLIECTGLNESRQRWWERLEKVLGEERWQSFASLSAEKKTDFLIGVPGEGEKFEGCSEDLLNCVLQGVNSMFRARKHLMYEEVW
jgi:hypothetical protein